MNFFLKQMLKVSAFYLEKRKEFHFLKKKNLGLCQYQNKKDLFTEPIFSEGFALNFNNLYLSSIQWDEFLLHPPQLSEHETNNCD